MKLIIFFHAAARKTIINCLVTTQHRPTPYEVELPHCFIIDSKCEKIESHIQKRTSIELMLFSFGNNLKYKFIQFCYLMMYEFMR